MTLSASVGQRVLTPAGSPRPILLPWAAGAAAALAMAALYVAVLVISSGQEHLAQQWASYWPVLAPLWVMFGAQVGMLVDLRTMSSHGLRSVDAAAAGSTAVGMLACCAHHVAELVPIVASFGIASVVAAWQPWILGVAVALSLYGTAATVRRWRRVRKGLAAATAPSEPDDGVQPCHA